VRVNADAALEQQVVAAAARLERWRELLPPDWPLPSSNIAAFRCECGIPNRDIRGDVLSRNGILFRSRIAGPKSLSHTALLSANWHSWNLASGRKI
jgi:hypothetical protein